MPLSMSKSLPPVTPAPDSARDIRYMLGRTTRAHAIAGSDGRTRLMGGCRFTLFYPHAHPYLDRAFFRGRTPLIGGLPVELSQIFWPGVQFCLLITHVLPFKVVYLGKVPQSPIMPW